MIKKVGVGTGSSESRRKPAPARRRTRRESPAPAFDASDASALVENLPGTRYLFFGGKGGVGKTTAAAATALLLLDAAAPGEQILLFSTDPAHSLSDSLDIKIGDRLVEAARRGRTDASPRLFARELDAARALEEFKTKHRAVLREIADRGTLLDEADINDLLDLSLPGMDEVMSLFELSEIDRASRFARIVVDTAPSGHTSRLLRLPDVFTRWLKALDVMSEKHRYMVAQFVRGRRPRADDVDLFLRELTERIAAVRAMLFDTGRAAFTLVTIPEEMAVEESARYFRTLAAEGVPVTGIIVNRVEREHGACPFCRSRARGQTRWLAEIEREFKPLRVRRVPLFAEEVRGTQALRRFARAVWGTPEQSDAAARQAEDARAERHFDAAGVRGQSDALVQKRGVAASKARLNSAAKRRDVEAAESGAAASRAFLETERRLLIFGGKGGVGKTTAAAACALAVAENNAEARVLVFSTDPAHSLSDSFGEPVGELKRGVAGCRNLDAMEIDPAARFEELKERYRSWTDELFESLTGNSRWEIKFDREAMRELVALAPPGIDEIAALGAISDLLEDETYTTIVLDTAPTGHLLRFLELPEVALSWVRTFIKLLLKYKNVIRWGGVAEELVTLSKNIKRVAALLTDAGSCEFIGVAIPERMSLEETSRMAERLGQLRVPMRRLLINNVVTEEAAGACEFCGARRSGQERSLKEFRRRFKGAAEIFFAPQQPSEITGRERLREHFGSWQLLP
ncbi:MAG TPA: ArsA family ATPase [Pyrinomonadaceae bacterium]|nr:ArsA family ATPase [Pyrinomonadaceae bacterium]